MRYFSIFSLILYAFLLGSCRHLLSSYLQETCPTVSVSFPKGKEYAAIPFEYVNGSIISNVIINNDTLAFLIDTGAEVSFLMRSDIDYTKTGLMDRIRDAYNREATLPLVRVNSVSWGEILIENHLFAKNKPLSEHFDAFHGYFDGVIGADILNRFVVKIDNQNRQLILSKTKKMTDGLALRVPMTIYNHNTPLLPLSIQGQEFDFIFDTGFSGEIRLTSAMFSTLPDNKLSHVWNSIRLPIFASDLITTEEYIVLENVSLGDRIFANAILWYDQETTRGLLGTVFMRRFTSVTIDFLNGYIYFELPEDNSLFSFSDNLIEAVPISNWYLLHDWINSFGFQTTDRLGYHTIDAMLRDDVSGVQIGDTLVGVNQTIFNKTIFNKLSANSDLFYLETDRNEQQVALNNVFRRRNESTFHFLKNGKIVSIHRTRNTILHPPSAFAYSFGETPMRYSIVQVTSARGVHIHLLPSTLVGEEVTLSFIVDGVETVLSNNPDVSNPLLDNTN